MKDFILNDNNNNNDDDNENEDNTKNDIDSLMIDLNSNSVHNKDCSDLLVNVKNLSMCRDIVNHAMNKAIDWKIWMIERFVCVIVVTFLLF